MDARGSFRPLSCAALCGCFCFGVSLGSNLYSGVASAASPSRTAPQSTRAATAGHRPSTPTTTVGNRSSTVGADDDATNSRVTTDGFADDGDHVKTVVLYLVTSGLLIIAAAVCYLNRAKFVRRWRWVKSCGREDELRDSTSSPLHTDHHP